MVDFFRGSGTRRVLAILQERPSNYTLLLRDTGLSGEGLSKILRKLFERDIITQNPKSQLYMLSGLGSHTKLINDVSDLLLSDRPWSESDNGVLVTESPDCYIPFFEQDEVQDYVAELIHVFFERRRQYAVTQLKLSKREVSIVDEFGVALEKLAEIGERLQTKVNLGSFTTKQIKGLLESLPQAPSMGLGLVGAEGYAPRQVFGPLI